MFLPASFFPLGLSCCLQSSKQISEGSSTPLESQFHQRSKEVHVAAESDTRQRDSRGVHWGTATCPVPLQKPSGETERSLCATDRDVALLAQVD